MPADVGGAGLDTVDLGCFTKRSSAAPIMRCTGPAWRGPPTSCSPCTPRAARDAICSPAVRGEKSDCLAMTEPGAGSDLRGMKTTAVRGWRRLGHQRHQAFHQPRRPRRLRHPVRGIGRGRDARAASARRSPPSSSTRAPRGSPSATATATSRIAATTTASSNSTIAGCRRARCWARSTRASRSPIPGSAPRACRSPPPASAAPSARSAMPIE